MAFSNVNRKCIEGVDSDWKVSSYNSGRNLRNILTNLRNILSSSFGISYVVQYSTRFHDNGAFGFSVILPSVTLRLDGSLTPKIVLGIL